MPSQAVMDEPSEAAVARLAWLIWCWREGYVRPEDRAPMTNWLLLPEEMLNPLDIAERDALLAMAREVLTT